MGRVATSFLCQIIAVVKMKLREKLYAYPWERMTENNCNSYLIDAPVRTLIDPGHLHLLSELQMRLEADGFPLGSIDLVIATHPHPDHCEGLFAFRDGPAKVSMHAEGVRFLEQFRGQWEALTGQRIPDLEMDFYLQAGTLNLAGETFQVIDTPGHAPGSICLYWKQEKALFSGDVIFHQGIGRVDLPGGDMERLTESITRLEGLDCELLLPGHGPHLDGRGAVRENFHLIWQLVYGAV